MPAYLVFSRSPDVVRALAERAKLDDWFVHAATEPDALAILRSVMIDAAIVEHEPDGVPSRKLLRTLATSSIPTLLVAERDDRCARAYGVPTVSPTAHADVVYGAFRAARALATAPCLLLGLASARHREELASSSV